MLNTHALLDRLQYFSQGLNPACSLTIFLLKNKLNFLFSPKTIDQEGDQKLKINFAWPCVLFKLAENTCVLCDYRAVARLIDSVADGTPFEVAHAFGG